MNINITREFDTRVQNYLSLLGSLNFIPTITKPTRFPSSINNPLASSPSTLDHIFINQIKDFRSIIFDYDISDHCGTALVFLQNDSINSIPPPRKITFRPYSEQNFANLYDKLNSTNWNLVLAQTDHDHQLLSFSNHVNSLYRACFPKKTKIFTGNRKKKGFLTPATMRKIKLKSHYFQLLKEGLITKQENNSLKNRLNKDIKRDKRKHYHNLFENAKNDMRKSWNTIKSLLGTNIKKCDAELIFDDALTETDRVDRVNQFNDFFTSIGHRLSADIPSTSASPTAHIPVNPHSFFLF